MTRTRLSERDPIGEARKWLAKHQGVGGSLPDDHRRSATGETIEQDQSTYLAGGASQELHRGLISYSGYRGDWSEELTDGVVLAAQGGRTPQELDTRNRMERALNGLRKDQQELLRMRYAERLTLEEIALELGTRKQSVHEKLGNALQDLLVGIAILWGEAPVPIKRSAPDGRGRPPRDREAEERAANEAIDAWLTARAAELFD